MNKSSSACAFLSSCNWAFFASRSLMPCSIPLISSSKEVIVNGLILDSQKDVIQEKSLKKTYRIYKNKNGEILSKEYINESYYPPINKIIIKGTKIRYNGIIV